MEHGRGDWELRTGWSQKSSLGYAGFAESKMASEAVHRLYPSASQGTESLRLEKIFKIIESNSISAVKGMCISPFELPV